MSWIILSYIGSGYRITQIWSHKNKIVVGQRFAVEEVSKKKGLYNVCNLIVTFSI